MAVIWNKRVNGTHYEVRTAGHSCRLYTDGVLHSQYNSGRPLAGGVWDLLMLPAFFYPANSIQRVLVLGVGGGAVIRLIHRFVQPKKMIGIELNRVHIQVAKKYFGVTLHMAELKQADALLWLTRYRGPPFDMIIDDLFYEQDGEPVRAVDPTETWFDLINSNLTNHGQLVMNFVGYQQLRHCAFFKIRRIKRSYKSAFQISRPYYANSIGVFLKANSSSKTLRENLVAVPALNPNKPSNRLGYTIRQLRT